MGRKASCSVSRPLWSPHRTILLWAGRHLVQSPGLYGFLMVQSFCGQEGILFSLQASMVSSWYNRSVGRKASCSVSRPLWSPHGTILLWAGRHLIQSPGLYGLLMVQSFCGQEGILFSLQASMVSSWYNPSVGRKASCSVSRPLWSPHSTILLWAGRHLVQPPGLCGLLMVQSFCEQEGLLLKLGHKIFPGLRSYVVWFCTNTPCLIMPLLVNKRNIK